MASLVQRGSKFYIAWRQDGKQRRKSTGTGDRREANRILKAWKREKVLVELRSESASVRGDVTPDEFWTRYSEWAEGAKAVSTWSIEQVHWRQFLAEFKPKTLGAVTADDVEAFKRRWTKLGRSPKTVNNILTAGRGWYNYALGQHQKARNKPFYGGVNPFRRIGRVEDNRRDEDRPFLDRERITRLLDVAKEHGQDLRLFTALGALAGLRKNEISNARWEWVSFEKKNIRVIPGFGFIPKHGRPRTIPLKDELAEILRPIRCEKGYIVAPDLVQKGRYRYDPRLRFVEVCKEADLEWVTPHILRHSFASNLAGANVSLFKIAKWMGHSTTEVTELYAHLQETDEDINLF